MWAVYRGGLAGAGLEWAAFGHIGNNHVHINILPRDMADLEKALGLYQVFAEKAVEFGGTVSAEHGIGKLKAKFLKTHVQPRGDRGDARGEAGVGPEADCSTRGIYSIG